MDKDNKPITRDILTALLLNLVIAAAVIAITQMSYETNDDYAIAARLAAGYPYVGFVNYFLCRPLIAVQACFPSVNVFILFQIILSFLSFTMILFTISRTGNKLFLTLASAAVICIFAFDHYSVIQFTKTAALAMTAGLIGMTDCLLRKRPLLSYLPPVLLLFLGACVRVDALPGAAAFACVFLFFYLVLDHKELSEDGTLRAGMIPVLIVLIALTAGAYGLDKLSCRINVGTDELRYAEDYSLYRSNIVDYPTYEYYWDNKEAYDAIGISENDIYLIDHWYFDYDGAASFENLKKIDEIERPQQGIKQKAAESVRKSLKCIVKGVKKRSFTGIHIILLCMLALMAVICLKPKHWLYVICTGMLAVSLYFAIHYMQRPTYRALYAADIGAAIWILYYAANEAGRGHIREKACTVISIALILVMLPLSAYARADSKAAYTAAGKKVMSEETEAYYLNDPDSLYVWDTSEKKLARVYTTPLKAPDGSDRNVTGTGSWGVLSPYMMERLGEYGVTNPIRDLIDNENAYYVGNKYIKRLSEYYTKWYGGDGGIVLEEAGDAGGYKVWRVRTSDELY